MRGHKNSHPPISADFLRSILEYSVETGEFKWIKTLSKRATAGKFAGFINKSGSQIRIKIGINGVDYMAHRLAWLYVTGSWPDFEVDHVNLDGTDNRWANLRLATSSQNQRNRRLQSNNTSGYKGVHKLKNNGKFLAYIKVHGKQKRLGIFDTAEQAYEHYVAAAEELHGEFSRI